MSRIIQTIYLLGAFAILGLLSACESPRAVVQTQIIKEAIPIATQPIKPGDIPNPPAPLGPRPPSAQQAADLAFSGYCQAIAFIIRAYPLLRLSAGEPPAQAPDYPECRKH